MQTIKCHCLLCRDYPRLRLFLAGLVLGLGSLVYPCLRAARAEKAARDWEARWTSTRDAWLADRHDWRDGKPFERRYTRHHREW